MVAVFSAIVASRFSIHTNTSATLKLLIKDSQRRGLNRYYFSTMDTFQGHKYSVSYPVADLVQSSFLLHTSWQGYHIVVTMERLHLFPVLLPAGKLLIHSNVLIYQLAKITVMKPAFNCPFYSYLYGLWPWIAIEVLGTGFGYALALCFMLSCKQDIFSSLAGQFFCDSCS